MKTAIAYTSDIILGRTGEVISRDNQKELIKKYAAANGIDIVAWYEDEMYNEDILARPGVQSLLAHSGCNTVLVERVWSFSRMNTALDKLYEALDSKGMKIECSTYLWDCISQMSRRHFDKTIPSPRQAVMVTREQAGPVKVAKPKKLNFVFQPLLNEVK